VLYCTCIMLVNVHDIGLYNILEKESTPVFMRLVVIIVTDL
jgi:hypothetical protein